MDKQELLERIRRESIPTFDVYRLVEQYIAHGSSLWAEPTQKTRRTHLKQFVDFLEIIDISDIRKVSFAVIDIHFDEYLKTHSRSTTNTHKRILKSFYSWLEEYKEMHLLVKARIIRSSKDKYTEPKCIDISTIKEVAAGADEQTGLIIALMTESGVRILELVRLEVGDIRQQSLHIRGKGSIDRMVYISPELDTQLRRFVTERQRTDKLFYNDKYNLEFSTKSARLHIQRAFMKHGIKMIPHQLRHTFAINLLENGCDIVTIQRCLGHQYITTTQEYLRVKDEFIHNQYKKYANSILT